MSLREPPSAICELNSNSTSAFLWLLLGFVFRHFSQRKVGVYCNTTLQLWETIVAGHWRKRHTNHFYALCAIMSIEIRLRWSADIVFARAALGSYGAILQTDRTIVQSVKMNTEHYRLREKQWSRSNLFGGSIKTANLQVRTANVKTCIPVHITSLETTGRLWSLS